MQTESTKSTTVVKNVAPDASMPLRAFCAKGSALIIALVTGAATVAPYRLPTLLLPTILPLIGLIISTIGAFNNPFTPS